MKEDGRWNLLKYLLSIDKKGTSTKYCKYERVYAFRFIPDNKSKQSNYSIDGELYPSYTI